MSNTDDEYAAFGAAVTGVMEGLIDDPKTTEQSAFMVILLAARATKIQFRNDPEAILDAMNYLNRTPGTQVLLDIMTKG